MEYFLCDQTRANEIIGATVISGGNGANKCIGGFNGKRERKKPLGRYKSRKEESIKVDFKYNGSV
jgi:hypothetical protein